MRPVHRRNATACSGGELKGGAARILLAVPLLLFATAVWAADTDGDGVDDAVDNCIEVPNGPATYPAGDPRIQRDTDGDGYGNVCDADLNNDGTTNNLDVTLLRAAFGTPGPDADFNGDGAVNNLDVTIQRQYFGKPPGPAGTAGTAPAAVVTPQTVSPGGYVGSAACASCHLAKHEAWSVTAHTQILRLGDAEANYINDADNSGHSDFFDGTTHDVRSLPGGFAFDALGSNAPKLGNSTSGPYVMIGSNTYFIDYTLGGSTTPNPTVADANHDGRILNGEAQYKQLYVTKIGLSNYVLPLLFNAKTAQYEPYDFDVWYDASNLPRTSLDTDTAYERRCAGCHSTGVEIAYQSNQWTMTFADINVACEACHGPGAAHLPAPTVAQKRATIFNPDRQTATTDLNGDSVVNTVDTLLLRNYVCYQCHTQGTGNFANAGGAALAYPSKTDTSGNPELYRPGMNLADYFTISQDKLNYWGAHDADGNSMINPHPGVEVAEKDYITSVHGSQQRQDHANGPHAADHTYDHPCYVCHDVHYDFGDPGLAHLVVTSNEGVPNNPSVNRNALCLSCHATHGDFAGITNADITGNTTLVRNTVRTHVKNRAFMDVSFETRCTSCHMPSTAKTANEGDVKSHVFEPIWPGFVLQPAEFQWTGFIPEGDFTVGPIPDSCNNCHAHDATDPSVDNIVTQWARSGHADGYGEPFNHWNDAGEVDVGCARCHSQAGFAQLADSSLATGTPPYTLTSAGINPTFTAVTAQSAIYPKVLNCNTCHEDNGGGETVYQAGKVQQVVFPSGAIKTLGDSSNICMQCHQGRESGLSVVNATPAGNGYYRFINRHYFAEAAIFFGSEVTAGFEYPGKTYNGKNGFIGHEQVKKQDCIQCHLERRQITGEVKKDHHFFPDADASGCNGCHYGVTDFADLGRPFGYRNTDYDGDGVGESFRHEVDGMQARLLAAMQAYTAANGLDPITYVPGGYPYFFNADTNASYATFDKKLLQAAFNYHSAQDPGSGIHNYKYVLQTLYDSIEDLGGNVTGLIRP